MVNMDDRKQMQLTVFMSSWAFEAVSNLVTSAKHLTFSPCPGSHSGDAGRAATR